MSDAILEKLYLLQKIETAERELANGGAFPTTKSRTGWRNG